MLTQIKLSKKGLSEVVGYVLLISFAVIIGAMVYAWMSSYIPKEKTECPEDVSLIVKSYSYDCISKKLEIEFQNKGLFNVFAFKIKGSIDPNREKATIELPPDNPVGYHIFPIPLSPDGTTQTKTINYDGGTNLAFVEISPYIIEDEKYYICSDAIIKQEVSCAVVN